MRTLQSKALYAVTTQPLYFVKQYGILWYSNRMKLASSSKTTCPITETAELLSDTWTMLIMRALTEGPKRFSELEAWLGDISTRTLTLKLAKLKKQGLVTKTRAGFYSPTRKGNGLKIIERAMIAYGKKYLS